MVGMSDLPDLFMRLERRIARLERSTGSSAPIPSDFILLLGITGLALQAQTVTAVNQQFEVRLRYGWNAITLDPDDPAQNADTLDVYLTSYTTDGVHYTPEQATTDTEATVGPFAQNIVVTFRVRARSMKGAVGAYASINTTTTADSTSPNQPSTPTVAPYLGQLMITWNGLDTGAAAMPTDFRFCEIHVSTTSSTFTPSSATLKGAFFRPGGSFLLSDLTYGTTYYARLVGVDTVGNRSVTSAAGSGIPERLVNADIADLAVNNAKIADLSAGKITSGVIQALAVIACGDPAGAHVDITNAGLSFWDVDGDGALQQLSSFGDTGTGDYLSISEIGGNVIASISDAGDASFQGLEVLGTSDSDGDGAPDRGVVVYGRDFMDWMDEKPRGVIAYGNRGTVSASVSGSTEGLYLEVQATIYPWRLYKIYTVNLLHANTTADARSISYVRVTTDGTQPTAASGYIGFTRTSTANTGVSMPALMQMPYSLGPVDDAASLAAGPKELRVLLTYRAESGAMTIPASTGCYLMIEDCGWDYGDIGIDRSGGTTTKKSYTSTWPVSNSETYKSDGNARTDTDDMVQGYNSSNGDQFGVCIFGSANSYGGQTNVTVATAMSGATLTKAEIYLYANHWYYNAGGTAIIRAYNSTSLSSTTPTGTTINSGNWPKPGGRWVNITSIATSAIRGVTLGRSGGSDLHYYGRFNGHLAANNKPVLRLTYVK